MTAAGSCDRRVPAAVEGTVAHIKTRRMLGEEGGRFRKLIEKFAETLAAINGHVLRKTLHRGL